jgi:hypothetical protein
MNRKDYMDGRVDHHTYYSALADVIGRKGLEQIVGYIADRPTLARKLAVDENLNNIPLAKWDNCHYGVLDMVKRNGPAVMAVSWCGVPLTPGTICWSLSESVCVLKTVAREMAVQESAS